MRNRRDTTVPKRESRTDAKESKKEGKIDLTLAKAELSRAKAAKRKWLVFLIGIGLVAYFVLSSGAGSGALNMIKNFLPGGD